MVRRCPVLVHIGFASPQQGGSRVAPGFSALALLYERMKGSTWPDSIGQLVFTAFQRWQRTGMLIDDREGGFNLTCRDVKGQG